MPSFEIEDQFKGAVGGVDEVGRGPWAGPVVAAVAVFLEPQNLSPVFVGGIQDSKKLSKLKRDRIHAELMGLDHFHYGIGEATVDEIDRFNILKATFLAMERAIVSLPEKPQTLLIDGKYIPSFPGIQTHPIIGGDGKSLSIAAASIIAKCWRDQLMEKLALKHPYYGWERNAGYGTVEHQQALKIHGVTPHHRRSFAPIKALLGPL